MTKKNKSGLVTILPEKLTIPEGEERIILTQNLNSCDIYLKESAKLALIGLITNGWEDRRTLNFHFEGSKSEATCLFLIIGRENKKFTFETISRHKVSQTRGYYYVRNVLFDAAMVDYKGDLVIEKPAKMTDCYLAHHSLMLSKDAKAYSIPSLEIEADDVKAGHSASMGNVDEELLFYLQSRGLSKNDAEKLLVAGFMQADFDKIPNEDVRRKVEQEIKKLLLSASDAQSGTQNG